MNKQDCDFTDGFKYNENNFTWTAKQDKGLMVSFLLLSIFGFLSLNIANMLRHKKRSYWRYIIALSILLFSISYNDPVMLTFPFSIPLTLGVRTPEFLDLDTHFPNHRLLDSRESIDIYKAELHKLLQETDNSKRLTMTMDSYGGSNYDIGQGVNIDKNTSEINSWRLMTVKIGNKVTDYGNKYFPELVKNLENTPEVVSCIISILEPRVTIPIHVGYFKGLMRYMIPLMVPKERENVFLCLNGIKYSWS